VSVGRFKQVTQSIWAKVGDEVDIVESRVMFGILDSPMFSTLWPRRSRRSRPHWSLEKDVSLHTACTH
jgi:hypothetical protein